MKASRRHFLKTGAIAAGASLAGATTATLVGATNKKMDFEVTTKVLSVNGTLIDAKVKKAKTLSLPVATPAASRQGVPGRKWVMVIDLARCDGCGECMRACGKMHFIPPDRQWIKILRMQDSDSTAPYFFPQPCYHCDHPPCTKVCPVDATFKREDGIVLIDNTRCIGCRFCMAACPYGARSFNWGHPHDPPEATSQTYSPERGYPRRVGTVEKCDFCPERAAKGRLPACVAACAKGVFYYGDKNEDAVTNAQGETRRFSALIEEGAGYRHLEELGTEPSVYYLPPRNRMFPPPSESGKKDTDS